MIDLPLPELEDDGLEYGQIVFAARALEAERARLDDIENCERILWSYHYSPREAEIVASAAIAFLRENPAPAH